MFEAFSREGRGGDARDECLDLDSCSDYAGRAPSNLQIRCRVFASVFSGLGQWVLGLALDVKIPGFLPGGRKQKKSQNVSMKLDKFCQIM